MKKKLFAFGIITVCLSVLAAGTWAYYTASGRAHNVITTASVGIEVEEWQMENGERIPYPQEAVAVMPGSRVSKIVTIRNKKAESFIRACVEIILRDRRGKERLLTPEEAEELLHFGINSDKWRQKHGDDLWWYYTEPVTEGAVTEPFLTDVTFDGPGMTNAYQSCTIEIHIAGQAVQTANNSATALTAYGWPGD